MINCSILQQSITTQLSTNLLFVWIHDQFSFFDEQMNRCIFRYKLVKSAKIKIKTDEETNMSLISADWLIQSISIKSDLPIFSDLSIDYSGILNICQKYWNASKCLCTGRVTTLVLLKLTLGLIKWTIGSVNKEIFSTLYNAPINVDPVGGGGVQARGRDLTNFKIFWSNSPGWETKGQSKVSKKPPPQGKNLNKQYYNTI